MKLKFVYLIFPAIIRYTEDPIKGFAGSALGPSIKIQEKYKEDKGLLEHELTHVRQFYKTLGLLPILYHFDKFKYKYEVEAYRIQLKYAKNKKWAAELFAGFIADRYNLEVDASKVKEDLLA